MTPKKVKTRPSSASLWLSCPGSAWVEAAVDGQPVTLNTKGEPVLAPGQASGPYAAEGKMGHAHLSAFLTGKPVKSFLNKKKGDKFIELPEADIELVKGMADIIQGIKELNGFEMHIETLDSVTFKVVMDTDKNHQPTEVIEQVIWGKSDVTLVNDTQIMVLDYKHGAGMPVNVHGNPQLTLYGMMGLEKWPGRALTIGVIQPRGRGRGIDLWDCSVEYLNTFEKNVTAAVRKVYDPYPTFNEGSWCKEFCSGRELGACPAKLENALRYAVGIQGAKKEHIKTAWWLIDWVKSIESIGGKVKKEAEAFIRRGGKVPGYKLEKRAGHRHWNDSDEVAAVLAALVGADPEEFLQPRPKRKPIGIMAAERHPKLKGLELGKYMHKPTTEVLVKEAESLQLFDDIDE